MLKVSRYVSCILALFSAVFCGSQAYAEDLLALSLPYQGLSVDQVPPIQEGIVQTPVTTSSSGQTAVLSTTSTPSFVKVDRRSSGMLLVVDRVDGDEVILETEAGPVRFPAQALPQEAVHEGAMISLHHTPSQEQRRLSSARARIERMKRLSTQPDA